MIAFEVRKATVIENNAGLCSIVDVFNNQLTVKKTENNVAGVKPPNEIKTPFLFLENSNFAPQEKTEINIIVIAIITGVR